MTIRVPERSDLTTDLFIDGMFRAGADTVPDYNPAAETHLADVAAGSADDVDEAVRSSHRAFTDTWGRLTGAERAVYMHRLADLVDRDASLLAALEALDVGKPHHEGAALDVPNTAATLRHYAGWADKIGGATIPTPNHMGRPTLAYSTREPLGVVGAIVPWNSPLMITMWKLAPALCAGNTVIVKPPELAPLSVLHLARLIQEADFPAGTVNIVPGTGKIAGEALVAHRGVAKISFTGSTATGRHLAQVALGDFKHVSLELGGKSPQIILPDADLDAAIAASALGLFANQGEVCASGSRILAHRSVYGQVVEGLVHAANAHVLGDPFDPETTMGPLISRHQQDVVNDYIARGVAAGARRATSRTYKGDGYFVAPTIFDNATNDMAIAREEIFGPVGTVIPFDDPADAIALANDSQYGLAASIWTKDISQAHLMARQVVSGTVWINGWGKLDPALPWGGPKNSGGTQELGWAGILANTSEKIVTVVL